MFLSQAHVTSLGTCRLNPAFRIRITNPNPADVISRRAGVPEFHSQLHTSGIVCIIKTRVC